MITPSLEKLILDGKAVFRNHVWGMSQYGTLAVPKGKVVIITDLWIYPHLGRIVDAGPDDRLDLILQAAVFRYRFRSRKSDNSVVCRHSMNAAYSIEGSHYPRGEETLSGLSMNNPIHMNVFFTHFDLIHIDVFLHTPRGSLGAIGEAPPPDRADEPPYPSGYGGTAVIQAVGNFDGTSVYNPGGVGERTVPNQISGESRDQLLDNLLLPNVVNPGANRTDCYTYPLVNIGYVVLNKTDSAQIGSTS